jgi:hypothetical protein
MSFFNSIDQLESDRVFHLVVPIRIRRRHKELILQERRVREVGLLLQVK